MQAVTDLKLPELTIDEPNFLAVAAERFADARTQHPWLAKVPFGYLVTEYAAMRDLLLMDDRLRPPHDAMMELMDAHGSRWERFQMESVLAMNGDAHKRIRDIVAPAFTPRAANQHRNLMRETISKLLDEWVPKGQFDFEEFASFFPITVMCRLIGASPEIVPRMRTSLETLGLSFNLIPGFLPKLNEACEVVEDCIDQLMNDRRAGKRLHANTDLLDSLVEAQDKGGLTDPELKSLLTFLFVAGYDTSKNVMTMIMKELMDRPDIYERCAQDLDYCHKVMEENLRYWNPGTSSRLTNDELVYRDVKFPKNTLLFLPNSLAGRDPAMFPDPDKINPDRPNAQQHIAFGRGMHMCLGQYIARAQIEEGLHIIAQRLKNPKLVGTYGYRPFPGTSGLKGLPISFTAATARATAAE